ncbi:MAG: MGMT family protein [Deltaproteobacteria bacterium]|nr:MGMT family protein [Deltaproteobacteria bacterium]
MLVGEPSVEAALQRLAAEHAAVRVAPPPEHAALLAALAREARGEPVAYAEVVLDERGLSAFRREVGRALRELPRGCTVTYGELARRLGRPGAARAVGHALARNPFPLVVPCHRVVGAAGNLGGFSLPGGPATKRRLLSAESRTGDGEAAPRTCLEAALPLH